VIPVATLDVATPRGRRPEREYAVQAVAGMLGLAADVREHDQAHWSIGLVGERGRITMPDLLLGASDRDWMTQQMLPTSGPSIWSPGDRGFPGRGDIHAVLRDDPAVPWLDEQVNGDTTLRLSVDVLGTAFLFLTRLEEVLVDDRDAHGRFPADAAYLDRHGILHRPVVDEAVEALGALLGRLWPRLPDIRRPRVVRPTHDVDWPAVTMGRSLGGVMRGAAGDVVERHDVRLAMHRLRARGPVRRGRIDADPGFTFRWIMDRSERAGVESAFYFIPDRSDPETDCPYDLDDPAIVALMAEVASRGHEVGVHPSYFCVDDPARLAREVARVMAAAGAAGVRQSEWGGRQHFLRWSNPGTWQAWNSVGLAYDATMCFPDRVGFRSGTLQPHRVFDVAGRTTLSLVERPTAFMEAALLADDDAPERIADLGRAHRRHGGDIVFLWHNTHLLTAAHRRVYDDVLAELAP
jgi:hypothetical protein